MGTHDETDPAEVPETDDLRSTLEDAFAEAEATEAGAPPPAEGEAPPTDDAADRGDGRTARGRFASRTEKPEAARTPDPATQTRPEPQRPPADPYVRAPQSWKPGAREAWQSLPADVRAEVYRREGEAARVMQESAQAREVASFADQLAQRYAPALQAEGVDVGTAAANLFETASQLRFGSPVVKAQVAARIIQAYGVDVEALAYVLEGSVGRPPPQQQQAPYQDPRVDQLFSRLNSMAQQRAQAKAEHANAEVAQFADGREFFEDVRHDMADLIDLAAKRGIDLPLDQAYERACSMHPEISKVLAARGAARNAGTGRQSTQRARAAASSVRGTPVASTEAPPDTLRGAIEAAIEAQER